MNKTITQFPLRAAILLAVLVFTILVAPSEAKAVTVTVVPTDGGTYRVEGTKLYVTPNSEYYLVSVMKENTSQPIGQIAPFGGEPYYSVSSDDNIIITFKKYSTNVHVTFDLNHHDGTPPNAQDLTLGQSVSQPTGIADDGNYTVCGWSTNRDGTKPYDFSTLLSNTLTYDRNNDYYILKLYAIWANANIDYTVSFNNNGGSGAMGDEMKSCGFLYTIPECDFTNDGSFFIGWATSASGSVAFSPGQTIFLTSDLTLYAKWEGDHTVSFNANGGGEAMSDVTTNPFYTIPACGFTRENYVFIGWATSEDGAVAYYPGQKITLTSDLTLYAVWAIIKNISGSGTVNDPYKIYTFVDLIGLASQVNGGNNYSGKYIQLMNNISFISTTDWNDATSTENNFPAIGNYYSGFCGVFDGDGYTISGIRIYKGGDTWKEDSEVGLFGSIGSGGTVKNLTLANARITGYYYVGGIVGLNQGGTIDNCHVLSNVAIHAVHASAFFHGGIVGRNDGNGNTVSHCTSAVTLSIGSEASGSVYGGIVGGGSGTLHDNLSIGVTIPAPAGEKGAIQGNSSGTLQHNYYSNCTVVGTTSGIGSCDGFGNNTDVTDNDGAVPATILSETEAVPAMNQNDKVVFRRSFTKDVASTVCLPFGLSSDQVTAAGNFYTFVGVAYDEQDGWVATMQAPSATTLTANTPYLFKPAATGPVLFYGTAPASVSAGSTPSTDNYWTFNGTYSRLTYETAESNSNPFSGKAFGFAAKNAGEGVNDVKAGEFVRAISGAYIPAFRAFLKYAGSETSLQARATRSGEAGVPEYITVRLIGKSGEIDGIGEIRLSTGEVTFDSNAWYDLNGRRLDGKPTQKGIYINGGKKIVIK